MTNHTFVLELTSMPFEVTETGWGEFEASIKIIFRDPEEEPVTLFHQIKLYPPGPPQLQTTKKVRYFCCIYYGYVCSYYDHKKT